MQRRSFLKTSALAGSAFLFSRGLPAAVATDEALIEVMLDEPLGTISPLIYSHFTEELGAVIYDGVWVGENSKIPNTGGIRTALIEKMRQIKAPAIRWPGGCFADSYDWRDGVGPRDKRPRRTDFWVDDPDGAYPAIALDANKQPVDSLSSNIGHLLGTGLLDAEQETLVARRLVSDELNSGFGLRTLATGSSGYWPLSYHGGSVWAHDTAIAIRGLLASGHRDEAALLGEGLLSAAESFDYRMPELHSGDSANSTSRALPYPAACRPQAWSAAAVIAVHSALIDG